MREAPERIYVYKIRTDDGDAPCVQNDLLSLTICKPMIRTAAPVGSVIVAFAANSLNSNNSLVYAAKVTERVIDGAYYTTKKYEHRRDCVYQRTGNTFRMRPGARAHASGEYLEKDLGRAPHYRRACVLLSNDFRYFGSQSPVDHHRYRHICAMLQRLNQGHRVNHTEALLDELHQLLADAWRHKSVAQKDNLHDDDWKRPDCSSPRKRTPKHCSTRRC